MRRLAPALALAAAAAHGQPQSDWERENEERLRQSQELFIAPPPFERARLLEVRLHVSADRGFRYFVDSASVSVADDRIVRYALLARSPSGVESVTFEGLRCPREYRIYAVGRPDGSWSGRPSQWRGVPRDPNAAQSALATEYFCRGRDPIPTAAEALRALKQY